MLLSSSLFDFPSCLSRCLRLSLCPLIASLVFPSLFQPILLLFLSCPRWHNSLPCLHVKIFYSSSFLSLYKPLLASLSSTFTFIILIISPLSVFLFLLFFASSPLSALMVISFSSFSSFFRPPSQHSHHRHTANSSSTSGGVRRLGCRVVEMLEILRGVVELTPAAALPKIPVRLWRRLTDSFFYYTKNTIFMSKCLPVFKKVRAICVSVELDRGFFASNLSLSFTSPSFSLSLSVSS